MRSCPKFALMIVLLLAPAVSAGTLSMRWAETPNATLNVLPQETATVEVWMDLLPGEVLSTVFFQFAIPLDGVAMVGPSVATQPGWAAGGFLGEIGDLAQFAVASMPPISNAIDGPGSYRVGAFEVAYVGLAADGVGQAFPIAAAAHSDAGVLDEWGNSFTWDARYHTSYASFVAYGDYGNPGWSVIGPGGELGQPEPNPLILLVIPEPATLALALLGGAALLGRQRG